MTADAINALAVLVVLLIIVGAMFGILAAAWGVVWLIVRSVK